MCLDIQTHKKKKKKKIHPPVFFETIAQCLCASSVLLSAANAHNAHAVSLSHTHTHTIFSLQMTVGFTAVISVSLDNNYNNY